MLLLVAAIGLIMTKNWGRLLIFIVFPAYFISSVFLTYRIMEKVHTSIYWNGLVPFFYVIILIFFNKQEIKNEFLKNI
jgi:hypothetical protein